tara:strand:- start:26 stop:928 length:903 start_codon:yes stop_codon:yes gene_type:complete
MKILLLGVNGKLGTDLYSHLSQFVEFDITPSTRKDFNLYDYKSIKEFLNNVCPDIVINCIAATNLYECESNNELAFSVNANFVKYLARASIKDEIPIIHFSTEHIFDGNKLTPYIETDSPNPINIYGISKLYGEKFLSEITPKFYIFRISWLTCKNGTSFFSRIIENIKKNEEFNVVNDQLGAPVTTLFIAEIITKIIRKDIISSFDYGIYHMTPMGYISRYLLAKFILNRLNRDKFFGNYSKVKIQPITTELIKSNVRYPLNCILNSNKLIKAYPDKIKSWDYYFNLNIEEYLKVYGKY